MAGYTDGWQELSVDMTVPAGATEAFFRLYNGTQGGSGRKVYWDNLSFTEIVAPFGPAWTGGATGGAADVDYTTVTLPEPSLARVNTIGGGWITFARNPDGVTFTPEPGAEGMVLTKVGSTAYRLSELDGTVTEFTAQGGVWAATSSWTAESDTTSRYIYDTTGSRLLLKKVINPAEPGVDDTNNCATATPARGCEVLEYEYATTTTAGLSQTVFGDYTDRVSGVKLWAWDPDAAAMTATQVTRYAYDNLGQLREVWDPRVTPALKTSYEYVGGRVTKVTPPGELPWNFDYGNPDVDSAGAALGSRRRLRHRRRRLLRQRTQRHHGQRRDLGAGQRPGQPGRPGGGVHRRHRPADQRGRHRPVQHLLLHRRGLGTDQGQVGQPDRGVQGRHPHQRLLPQLRRRRGQVRLLRG